MMTVHLCIWRQTTRLTDVYFLPAHCLAFDTFSLVGETRIVPHSLRITVHKQRVILYIPQLSRSLWNLRFPYPVQLFLIFTTE